jgi:hypothetical protein
MNEALNDGACNAFTLLNKDILLFLSQHKSKDVFSRNFATEHPKWDPLIQPRGPFWPLCGPVIVSLLNLQSVSIFPPSSNLSTK